MTLCELWCRSNCHCKASTHDFWYRPYQKRLCVYYQVTQLRSAILPAHIQWAQLRQHGQQCYQHSRPCHRCKLVATADELLRSFGDSTAGPKCHYLYWGSQLSQYWNCSWLASQISSGKSSPTLANLPLITYHGFSCLLSICTNCCKGQMRCKLLQQVGIIRFCNCLGCVALLSQADLLESIRSSCI